MSKYYKKQSLWGKEAQVDKFDEDCSYILVRTIQKMRKTSRRTKINKWISQFEKLRTLDGIERKRIKDVLYWYISHLKDKYIPKIYSADGFRNKFFQIEAAMKQVEEDDDFRTETYKKGNTTTHIIHYDG